MVWTKKHEELLRKGFLQMNDGTLIPWKPVSSDVDKITVDLSKMKVSTVSQKLVRTGFEADIADALYEWCNIHGGDPEKLIAECGFKRIGKTTR